MLTQIHHHLDLDLDTHVDGLDLFAEEVQPSTHTDSDCASTLSSLSTSGTAASFSSMGSIVSCGS